MAKGRLRIIRSIGAVFLPFFLLIDAAQADAARRSPAAVNVTLTTTDGVDLKATFYPSDRDGPGVVLVHMCRGDADRRTWAKVAAGLAADGVHAIAVDLRGYGESGGGEPPFTTMANFISFWRSTGMNDIDAAFDFLTAQSGVDAARLGVGGASCGVFMGIEAAARRPEVKTMVLLSGPFDDEAATKLASLDHAPVLGAASEDDTQAYEAMKRVFLATGNPESRNLQFKGDAHGTDMFNAQPDFESAVISWFTDHL